MKIAINCLKRYKNTHYSTLMFEELDKKYPNNSSQRKFDFKNPNRTVHLDQHGQKQVWYEVYSDNRDYSKEYKEDLFRISKYYNDLEIAELRVFCHILLPGLESISELEKRSAYNKKIYEEHGYTDESEKLVKNIHNGILSWWD